VARAASPHHDDALTRLDSNAATHLRLKLPPDDLLLPREPLLGRLPLLLNLNLLDERQHLTASTAAAAHAQRSTVVNTWH
jgi:hypothetical protein